MLVYSFLYVAGVISAAFLERLPGMLALSVLLILGLIAFCYCRFKQALLKYSIVAKIVRYFSLYLISFCLAALHGHLLLSEQFDDINNSRDCTLIGDVVQIPRNSFSFSRFTMKVDSIRCASKLLKLSKVSLNLYRAKYQPEAGDKLTLKVRLKSPRALHSEGAFDTKLWAINNGVNATGYVREITHVTKHAAKLAGLRHSLKRWLQKLEISDNSKSTLMALVLGDKSEITAQQWQQMRATGTVHLLIVSGLHIGIMVAIGWWLFFVIAMLLRAVRFPLPLLLMPEIGALSLSLAYVLLVGASLSTQRAWLMAFILIAGSFFSAKVGLWQRWWLALIIIISWQPLSVMQPGLWLSFAAVASLICLQGLRIRGSTVWLLIHGQWLVWLGLMPLLLLYFQQVSLLSPLINLFAISFISLLILLLIPALLVAAYGWQGLLNFVAACLDYFWIVLDKIAEQSEYFLFEITVIAVPFMLLITLACFAAMLPLPKRIKLLGLGAVLLILYPPVIEKPTRDQFKLTLIDVGQGLAVLIETHSHALLYDTGAAFDSGFNYFDAVIKPLLAKREIKQLDLLVISHTDNDHSGGLEAAQSYLRIKRLDSELAGNGSIANAVCESGKKWQWQGVSFYYRQPDVTKEAKTNNKSCVLEIASEHCKVLIMGDAQKSIESRLLASEDRETEEAIDKVLIVGHHGSNTSTHAALLAAEQFNSALVSSGYRNRYNHPHGKVLQRLKLAGMAVYRTDLQGSLEVRSTAEGCEVSSFLQNKRRYWQP
ncbi:MAG: DNA internalization-related competence protein ComEC/Rec2 [Oceanospirillaceae bacterium]